MATSDCLFNGVVPAFIRNGPCYQGGTMMGSQFGVPVTVTSDLGRRCDTLNFELVYVVVGPTGRKVLASFIKILKRCAKLNRH
jgi:hypothetical protein